MRVVKLDYWRSFVPYAPDYEVLLYEGEVFRFDFPKDILIQGARDVVSGVSPSIDLDVIPVQRGWRLTPIPQAPPMYCTVKPIPTGFILHAISYIDIVKEVIPESIESSDLDEPDGIEECFNYTLSNGFQESNVGTITLKIIKGYQLKFKSIRQKELHQFLVTLAGIEPNGLRPFLHTGWTWYQVVFDLQWDAVIQNFIVKKKRILLDQYGVKGSCSSSTGCTYWLSNNQIASDMEIPSDVELGYGEYHATRSTPYFPKGDRGDIEIECRGFYGNVKTSEYVDMHFKFSEIFGEKWWLHGTFIRDYPLRGQI